MSKIVNATSLDRVRIEELGAGRAVTVDACSILVLYDLIKGTGLSWDKAIKLIREALEG